MSCNEISADWAAQRIKGLTCGAAISNALRNSPKPAQPRRTSGEVIKTLIDTFQYPRKGPGMMWDAAADKIKQRGRRRSTWARRLDGLRWDERRRAVDHRRTRTEDGEPRPFTAQHVISSAPIRELVDGITPASRLQGLPPTALRYRDFLTVVADRRQDRDLFPDNWIYIHEPSVKVGRIQNFKSGRPRWCRTRRMPASAWNTSASRATACGTPPTPT